ncbi:MAG: ribosome silencing factor [Firmicutes bacterium]|jgi:ribosome-associated protein|nr:ribosome silencing factor [Bacillota bacterium]
MPLAAEAHARAAAQAAIDKKAEDTVALDISGVSLMADFFVLCSVRTQAHARAVREEVTRVLETQGLTLKHREGSDDSGWVLMDWGDVVVHIFGETERRYYDLERLWGDAPVLDLEGTYHEAGQGVDASD